jgi:hypothetical protein
VYFLLLYELVDDYVERRPAFREEHLRLARDDPYVREGLVKQWAIRQWTVVIGGE